MTYNLAGIDIELAYTVRAKKALAAEFDGFDNIAAIFDAVDENEIFEDVCLIASILTQAAAERDRLRANALGTEPTVKGYTAEEIEALATSADIVNLAMACIGSMSEGNKTTVELAEQEKKTAAAGRKRQPR